MHITHPPREGVPAAVHSCIPALFYFRSEREGRHLVLLEPGPKGARKEPEETTQPPPSGQVLEEKRSLSPRTSGLTSEWGSIGAPRNQGELRPLFLGSFPTCTARPHEALPTALRAQQAQDTQTRAC